jgi:regulator of protease activity HflC (stomatin/prohibitin superfamily)
MTALYVVVAVVAVIGLLALFGSIRVLKQYERGVQFRLGKVKDGARGAEALAISAVTPSTPNGDSPHLGTATQSA